MTPHRPEIYVPGEPPASGSPGGAPRNGKAPPIYHAGRARADRELARRVEAAIEVYPDFPRPGIQFRDITPVLRDPEVTRAVVERMADEARLRRCDVIGAVESRGFLFGAPVATSLGLPLVVIRKEGKLPGDTVVRSYDLEYGEAELELQTDALAGGQRVLVVDDLLATGGTIEAAAHLVERTGGSVGGIAVLVELTALDGRETMIDYNVYSTLAL
jgi:adenine phosphoribosyltransferase